jgi:hypothetical protein
MYPTTNIFVRHPPPGLTFSFGGHAHTTIVHSLTLQCARLLMSDQTSNPVYDDPLGTIPGLFLSNSSM